MEVRTCLDQAALLEGAGKGRDGMIDSIRSWNDLETSVPRKHQVGLRLYRVLQEMNRARSCSGQIARRDVLSQASTLLGVSREHVRQTLQKGQDVFWHDDGETVWLFGFHRVYDRFGCYPSTTYPARHVPLDRIGGNMKNFRGFVASLTVLTLQAGAGGLDMGRHEMARHLGVSLPTMRSYQELGWIECTAQVEVLERHPIENPWGMELIPIIPVSGRERRMRVGDEMLKVRQHQNRYRSTLSPVADDHHVYVGDAIAWQGRAGHYWIEVLL